MVPDYTISYSPGWVQARRLLYRHGVLYWDAKRRKGRPGDPGRPFRRGTWRGRGLVAPRDRLGVGKLHADEEFFAAAIDQEQNGIALGLGESRIDVRRVGH